MEALPTMPMISPNFRTSTLSYDNIPNFDFRLRMKEYILLNFNTDPHEYDSAFDELAQMKFEANIPAATVEQICKLKRYYGQLCMMQKRFPMGAGEQLETPFTWHDGLVDMRSVHSEVTICDIEFEKASVMFNIGTCHAQYAAEQTRDTQDSIKAAFMHFQYAAYAFEQLNSFRNADLFYPSVDLDANVISFYYKVLIAQAQECLVQKSLLDNRSAIVIAKLSLWLQEAFDSAVKMVDDWNINIPESQQRYYAKMCQIKSDIYGVIAYMSLGDHSEKEDKKMGWRLQYYNIANKYQEQLQQIMARLRDRHPELFIVSSFLFDVITAKQKNAEKENDFIYHDRVPKQEEAIDTAQKDGAMCKVKTLSFDPMDPSVCGPDLFGKLLPSHVQDAKNKYTEKKEEILKEMTEIIKSYDDHLNYQLQLAEFDKLRFMLSEGKNREAWFEISEDLMKRNADMTSYPDCVPILIDKMRESSDTARVAEAKLNTLLSKLRSIDLPRLKADEGFNLIQKELERLAEHLEQAKANNVSLNKAIAQHSGNLQLLTLPCMEMWQKIVPMEEENSGRNRSEMSAEETQVRKMVDKVMEMQGQRHKLLDQLAADLKVDDISNKLMGTNERGAEEIMSSEIVKHSNAQQLIRLNCTAQEAILRAFADANADFFEERSEMSTKKVEYDRRVGELCASYEVYRDVARKCDEGEQFYRQLMARCDQFAIPVHAMEEQYREELEKKEKAQKEAEHHMNQLRMSREAQKALMDFGGQPGGGGPQGPMGSPGAQYPPMGPPGGVMGPPRGAAGGARAPRLGDYLDSYRARKQNPQVQIPQDHHQIEGPPSPTPSSICDFPVSSSQRSQRFGGGGAPPPPHSPYQQQQYSGGHSPNPAHFGPQGSYGPPQGPPMSHGYQGPQQSSLGPQGSYGGPPPPPAQIAPGPPTPTYHHSYQPPVPGGPNQYQQTPPSGPAPYQPPARSSSVSSYAPSPVQNGPAQYQAPGPHHGGPEHGYAPAPIQSGPAPYQDPGAHSGPGGPTPYHQPPSGPGQYQAPASGPAPYQIPGQVPEHGYAPSPIQSGPPPPSYQATVVVPQQQYPPSSVAQGQYQAPTGGPGQAYAPSPVPNGPGGPYQASGPHPGGPVQNGPGGPYPPNSMAQGQYQAAPYQAPPTSYPPGSNLPVAPYHQPPSGPGQYQAPASGPAPYQTPGQAPGHGGPGQFQAPASQASGPPTSYQAPPPLQPSYQPLPPPAQPIYQHPPQGAPISSPAPPTQQHQHVASSTTAPGAPAPAQGSSFTPTPGAPSPWHATPAELKTPWNTTPQYHAQAPPTSAQQAPPTTSAQQAQAPPTSTRSNIDLLSDLLGDFNMAPPIQPTFQNTQHQQAPPTSHAPPPPRQDFRVASNPPEPPGKPVRPAATVQPMPQQPVQHAPPPPPLSQIAQQTAQNATETPILVKGTPSLTELSDPSKFQLGEGNMQKLEKRMLHESFRTNGPPPPLNPIDPLNQIDAFSFAATRQK